MVCDPVKAIVADGRHPDNEVHWSMTSLLSSHSLTRSCPAAALGIWIRKVYSVAVVGFTKPAQRTAKVLSTEAMLPGAF